MTGSDMSAGVKTAIMGFSMVMIFISFAIGWWAKKKVTNAQAFFGATALFGPVVVSLSSMAAVASAFALVGVPGLIYSTGNTITFWMLGSCGLSLAYIILGKKVRAMAELGPVSSLGDISDLRFNNSKAIKALMSVILFIGCLSYLASQIKAGSEFFGHLFGWEPWIAGFVIFGVLTAYTAISGEVGGLLTQAFQGFVMVLAGLVMVVGFFIVTGGLGEVLDVVSEAGTITDGKITKTMGPDLMNAWGSLPPSVAMAWMLIPIIGVMGQPQVLTRMYALKDPMDMPKAGLYGGLSHVVVGLMAVLMGYGALYLVAKGIIPPLERGDQAIFLFADHMGLTAQLFVYAAILAAAMSSASLFLSLSANIIARDLPSSFGLKNTPETQVKISRVAIVIIGLSSILFTFTGTEAVAILGTFGWGTLMSATFPVFVIGLLWKRATTVAVTAGLAVALVTNIISLVLSRTGFSWPGALPWYVNVITVTVGITIFLSLITKDRALNPGVEAVIDL